MKNFIIGYGETLTDIVNVKNGSGEKKHPYTITEGRKRLTEGLEEIISEIQHKAPATCANDEVVVKFIQHPSYLAKTYYPRKFFRKFGMRDVGSRSIKVSPDKWGIQDPPTVGLSSCVYVAGTKKQYQHLLEQLKEGQIDEGILQLIRTIEKIDLFDAKEKIKNLDDDPKINRLEVVIHASSEDEEILSAFNNYVASLEGLVELNKIKIVGGLTFVPVVINRGMESSLAEFSHLRALRSVPKLRVNKPDVIRELLSETVELPTNYSLSEKFKVCVFDGGIGNQHLLSNLINEIIPENVNSVHPTFLSHGSEVCSTYLFGNYDKDNKKLGIPYTSVDIVRVISDDDTDPDLFDVLTRIENVLVQEKYKYINLSLGPRIAIDDDEVHVWTSVLDKYLQKGDCLAIVAIGNDGDLPDKYGRIQPPSDMVNSLSIGSASSKDEEWERASYSCIGPGRSPGLVKPDGLIFGGTEEKPFYLYSPLTHSIVGTMGTSYAAPYAMRVAAGVDALTDFNLNPSTVKALLVHNTVIDDHTQQEVGWGRFPHSPEEILECLEDEATIIFQGELLPNQHVRIPVTIPDTVDCTWVHLKATFCINAVTDPEHPLHYTRSGLDITFRPNQNRSTIEQEHPDTKSFFSDKNLYQTEEELREDAYKWETTISRKQRFKLTTLNDPVFDVKYHAREQGATPNQGLSPIKYSCILTIRTQGDVSLYNSILQQNRTLQALKVQNRIQL